MDLSILIFLSSGLFLGWSLGANDAANVFGTAVGSRMVRFVTAAFICSIFVILGAVISGAGAAHGLGKLGAVNALPGAFMVALAAAVTVYSMTKAGLPVSTTQAIVGGIVGWNWYSGSITDLDTLAKIVGTWIAAPILGAIFGALIYKLTLAFVHWIKPHLLRQDLYTRIGLILAGAAASYSLGANNIGNVMGVFVASSPFTDFQVGQLFTLSSVQQLFLLGAIAIAVGVFTYSKRVMMTVGNSIMPLTPLAAWVVVVAHAMVLFLFSSISLEYFLVSNNLPTIPLIPVSSSQAVVGAVIGIGMLKGLKGVRQIKWRVLLNISSGWISTPIISAFVCFFALFFLQNVFNQPVYREVQFLLSQPVLEHLQKTGITTDSLEPLKGKKIATAIKFRNSLREQVTLPASDEERVIASAEIYELHIGAGAVEHLDRKYLSKEQYTAVAALTGRSFKHKWQLQQALTQHSAAWVMKPALPINKLHNKKLQEQLDYLFHSFHVARKRI